MKTFTATFLHSQRKYRVMDRKLPTRYAVCGMPHQMPAFAYLSDTYGDDLERLNDCNSYHVFRSLKATLEFIENPYGHKGTDAAEQLADQLERWNVIEDITNEEAGQ